ncbi:MAG: hypothetical protein V4685_13900 [Bacteroidota bacterium]
MKKKIFFLLAFISFVFAGTAQNLQTFSLDLSLKEGGSNYISIANKKAYTAAEAKANKLALDFVLLNTSDWSGSKIEWYNMSGKDDKVPAELTGTASLINGISFDKDQFDKCKTTQDLKRMTSHITNNSFSHFASVGEKEVTWHCFIIQLQNGKRGLLWVDGVEGGFKVVVKMQG